MISWKERERERGRIYSVSYGSWSEIGRRGRREERKE